MDDSVYLNSLLEKVARFHPLYGGGLATHLPMVLIALNRMGASNKKLIETYNKSLHGLELIGNLDKFDMVLNIEDELGNTQSFKRYLNYYQNELAENHVKYVLEKALPVLISGVAASAFHGLFRLAYAIEAKSQSEIAIALAYWSAEYQPFDLNGETSNEKLEDILYRLSSMGENYVFSDGLIVDRMNEIGELLKRNQSIVQPKSLDLTTLKNFALQAFYSQEDFTLLHTVTGCHAFSIITSFIKDNDKALRSLWLAILVAYLSTGLAYKNEKCSMQNCGFSFDEIKAHALSS